ncbi:MAG: hypothetical protein WC058_01060 [Phycisphaeraceae bacterium]
MATGTVATVARKYHHDLVHYAAVPIVYTTLSYTVCKLPAGALVIDAGVVVTEAFAGVTPQTLDLGVTGNLDDFMSDGVLTTVGVIKAEDMATATTAYQAADIDFVATLSAGATTSAGAGYVYVEYIIADRDA